MENTRFLQSKKQKQKKKRRMYIFMAVTALICLLAGIWYQKKAAAAEDVNAKEAVSLTKDQYFLELEIEGMVGNEMEAASVEGGEASQYTIPVGTDVVTALGSVTTFSRLAQGDKISCLMEHTADEGDVILKIWIEE